MSTSSIDPGGISVPYHDSLGGSCIRVHVAHHVESLSDEPARMSQPRNGLLSVSHARLSRLVGHLGVLGVLVVRTVLPAGWRQIGV